MGNVIRIDLNYSEAAKEHPKMSRKQIMRNSTVSVPVVRVYCKPLIIQNRDTDLC